jgi:hypothetical protein
MFELKDFPFFKPLGVALISDLVQKVKRLELSYKSHDLSASLTAQGNHLKTWLVQNENLQVSYQVRELTNLV